MLSMLRFPPGPMPKTIEIPIPIKVDRLTRVARVKGVDVYIHWTVFLIAALMLVNSVRRPLLTLVGIAAYLSVLLIHELGHVIAAHWRGSEAQYIEIYPIHGLARVGTPYSRFDHCIIAWGGVVAQLVIAIPLVAWVAIFGYTPF